MNENAETQQEYFGVRTDNKGTLCNALKRIEELEEKLGNYQKGMFDEIEKRDIKLTKAKELLKEWLQTSKASGCDNINIVTDTEQFLKESE